MTDARVRSVHSRPVWAQRFTRDELVPARSAVVHDFMALGFVTAGSAVMQQRERYELRAGDVFLVPAGQSDAEIAEARAVAGDDLEIVPVATLTEAVSALAERGGNGLQLGSPGADYDPS